MLSKSPNVAPVPDFPLPQQSSYTELSVCPPACSAWAIRIAASKVRLTSSHTPCLCFLPTGMRDSKPEYLG